MDTWFILGIPAIVVINIVNIALFAMLGVMFSDENDDQSRHFKSKLYMNTIQNLFIQPVNAQGQWDPYEPDMGVESFPKLNHTGCGDDGYCYIEATAARGYCRSILMFDNKQKTLKELDEYDTHMFGDFIADMTPTRAMKLRRERSIILDYLLAAGCLKQSDIAWDRNIDANANQWQEVGCSVDGDCISLQVSEKAYPKVIFITHGTGDIMKSEGDCYQNKQRFVNSDGTKDPWEMAMSGSVREAVLKTACKEEEDTNKRFCSHAYKNAQFEGTTFQSLLPPFLWHISHGNTVTKVKRPVSHSYLRDKQLQCEEMGILGATSITETKCELNGPSWKSDFEKTVKLSKFNVEDGKLVQYMQSKLKNCTTDEVIKEFDVKKYTLESIY